MAEKQDDAERQNDHMQNASGYNFYIFHKTQTKSYVRYFLEGHDFLSKFWNRSQNVELWKKNT